MKFALLLVFLVFVELTCAARHILLEIEPVYDEQSYGKQIYKEDGQDYALNELDYRTPVPEGVRNDYFVDELLGHFNPGQQEEERQEEKMQQSLPQKVINQPFNPYEEQYMQQSLPHIVMNQPFKPTEPHESDMDTPSPPHIVMNQPFNTAEQHESDTPSNQMQADSNHMMVLSEALTPPNNVMNHYRMVEQPYSFMRPPFYYQQQEPNFFYNQPRTPFYYNHYQSVPMYQQQFFYDYEPNYYSSPQLWNYRMHPFYPFYYTY